MFFKVYCVTVLNKLFYVHLTLFLLSFFILCKQLSQYSRHGVGVYSYMADRSDNLTSKTKNHDLL